MINLLVVETIVHANVLNNLSLTLNIVEQKLEQGLDKITRDLYLNEIVINAVNILENLKSKMEGLRLAHQGIVSVNLLTPKEVENIVQFAIFKFLFHPLPVDIYSYYNLMTVKVVYDQVYILMPFNSDQDLVLSKITPFPMQIQGESVMLATSPKLILEKENNNLISIWEESNLDNCVIISEEYICHNDDFFLQPIVREQCINCLLNSGDEPL